MITYFLTGLLLSIIRLILTPISLLPNATLDPHINSSLNAIGGYFAIMNGIFPINTLLLVLGAVLVVEGFIFTYKIIMWIIKKIPSID